MGLQPQAVLFALEAVQWSTMIFRQPGGFRDTIQHKVLCEKLRFWFRCCRSPSDDDRPGSPRSHVLIFSHARMAGVCGALEGMLSGRGWRAWWRGR